MLPFNRKKSAYLLVYFTQSQKRKIVTLGLAGNNTRTADPQILFINARRVKNTWGISRKKKELSV